MVGTGVFEGDASTDGMHVTRRQHVAAPVSVAHDVGQCRMEPRSRAPGLEQPEVETPRSSGTTRRSGSMVGEIVGRCWSAARGRKP